MGGKLPEEKWEKIKKGVLSDSLRIGINFGLGKLYT